jgi:hypothetical protein
MTSEISDLIAALRSGSMTLDEVALLFRKRSWPRSPAVQSQNHLELAEAAQNDPEPYVRNSFDDVVAAYDQGKLTDDEYAVLLQAVTESKRAEDLRE